MDQIARRKLDSLPSGVADEYREQDQQRERRARLRQDNGIDGMKSFPGKREFAGKDGPAQSGGNSP